MPDAAASPALDADIPRAPERILPVVGRTRELGFPVRISDTDGTMRLMQQRSLRFDFVAAGMPFETQGEATERGGVTLSIRARLGQLPFSAESKPARQEVIALLQSPPSGARAGVTAGNQVVLDGNVALDELMTPVNLISVLTEWVVNVQPWLLQISLPLASISARQRAGT